MWVGGGLVPSGLLELGVLCLGFGLWGLALGLGLDNMAEDIEQDICVPLEALSQAMTGV